MTEMHSNILKIICQAKKEEVEDRAISLPLSELKAQCADLAPTCGFAAAVERPEQLPAIIAEIKYQSPTAGVICSSQTPDQHARDYAKAGARCLSILTESRWFGGCDHFLVQARQAVEIPILCKDFIVDPWQLYNARLIGADAILLIIATIDHYQALALAEEAKELGLDIIAEIHNRDEWGLARQLPVDIIGINNRNLKTLSVDLNTTYGLEQEIQSSKHTVISESGLKDSATLQQMVDMGVAGFLIGESLMKTGDPGQALAHFLSPWQDKAQIKS